MSHVDPFETYWDDDLAGDFLILTEREIRQRRNDWIVFCFCAASIGFLAGLIYAGVITL